MATLGVHAVSLSVLDAGIKAYLHRPSSLKRARWNTDIIRMGRSNLTSLIACAFVLAFTLPSIAVAARGEDSVAQFYCARGFAKVAAPIEKLFVAKSGTTNDYAAWTSMLKNQIANPTVAIGAAFKIPAKEAPQAIETVQWMIGILNGRTVTKPWQVAKLQALKLRLKNFDAEIQRTGEIPWKDYLELSADFSETMGRRAPIANPDVFTNNLAIDRGYIDRVVTRAVARQPFAIVMPTHRPMSIEELNDISPYPIFPAELVPYRQKADRQLYYPMSFFGHDLSHGALTAQAFEKQIKRLETGEITKAQYLRYVDERVQIRTGFTAVANQQSPQIRNALELLWFNFTHENIDHIDFTLIGELNSAAIRQVTNLKIADESALVRTTIFNMKDADIFDASHPKPTSTEIREAFTIFQKYAASLP
ncbi:hypothetical protein BH10BDE1_BH10BDE1_02910 [soil metagenome]